MDIIHTLLDRTGDFEATIGSGETCEIRLRGLERVHARLKREGDRLFLMDISGTEGAFVNRKRLLPNTWHEITRFDEVNIRGAILEISPRIFLGRDRVGIDTQPLYYRLPGGSGRVLCDGAYVRAKPGTLTMIMGPAGCGKTILLNLLSGAIKPDEGAIIVGERFALDPGYGGVRDYIGYVPQGDEMIPELTVRQSLHFRLRLKFPDMDEAVRTRLIRQTCRQLGLAPSRIDQFLDTRIGSSERAGQGLSGGERKRANIAHELISKPLILILDEPTTGLSSVEAAQIVRLLKALAQQELLTVVTTIHQPGPDVFECIDELIIMMHGGKLAYHGPAARAKGYFERLTGSRCSSRNPAEYLLEQVFDPDAGARLVSSFSGARLLYPDLAPPYSGDCQRQPSHRGPAVARRVRSVVSQVTVLFRRNARILISDRANLLLTFGQLPIIALLMLLAFAGIKGDSAESDRFARAVYYFDVLKAPYESANATVPVDALLKKADAMAREETAMVSQASARRRAAVYFAFVAAVIWCGLLGACKEIVVEQHVIRREAGAGVSPAAVVASKLLLQWLVAAAQTAVLVGAAAPVLLGPDLTRLASLWGILTAVAAASAALGLLVSSISPSYRFALTAVPVLMIPQLLFGGLLRSEVEMKPDSLLPKAVLRLTVQRWGFESALATDVSASSGMLKQEFGKWRVGDRYWELNMVRFKESGLVEEFFPPVPMGHLRGPIAWLCLATMALSLGAYLALRLRFSSALPGRRQAALMEKSPHPVQRLRQDSVE